MQISTPFYAKNNPNNSYAKIRVWQILAIAKWKYSSSPNIIKIAMKGPHEVHLAHQPAILKLILLLGSPGDLLRDALSQPSHESFMAPARCIKLKWLQRKAHKTTLNKKPAIHIRSDISRLPQPVTFLPHPILVGP